MEFVSLNFIEEVIEKVSFRIAKAYHREHDRKRPWNSNTDFSQFKTWSCVAVDVAEINRFVQLKIAFPAVYINDTIALTYESVQVYNGQLCVRTEGTFQDLPVKRNILVGMKVKATRRFLFGADMQQERVAALFEEKNLQITSSTEATFPAAFRQQTAAFNFFLKVAKTRATVIAPLEFTLEELIELKKTHQLARHQPTVRSVTADDFHLPVLLAAIPNFDFQHVLINSSPISQRFRIAERSHANTLKINFKPQNADPILHVLAQQSCSIALIGQLSLYRELSQCEQLRSALAGQTLCVQLNQNEDNLKAVRFVLENFDYSDLVFGLPLNQRKKQTPRFLDSVLNAARGIPTRVRGDRSIGVKNCLHLLSGKV